MTEPTTMTLAKFIVGLLPGAVGAAIALRFNTANASVLDRLLAFLAGAALAHYAGSALAQWYGLDGFMADATKVAVGLFGLALVANVMAEIPALIAFARRRLFGDSP